MNTVTLVGRLGQDPEVNQSQGGKKFAKFSLATNDGFGENKKTNWHKCIAFGKIAELIESYVKKGNELAVNGSLDYQEYEGKWFTSILVNNITFIKGAKPTMQEATAIVDKGFEPANNDDDSDLPF